MICSCFFAKSMLVSLKGGRWLLEQPASSLCECMPRFVDIVRLWPARPIKLLYSGRFLHAFVRHWLVLGQLPASLPVVLWQLSAIRCSEWRSIKDIFHLPHC